MPRLWANSESPNWRQKYFESIPVLRIQAIYFHSQKEKLPENIIGKRREKLAEIHFEKKIKKLPRHPQNLNFCIK